MDIVAVLTKVVQEQQKINEEQQELLRSNRKIFHCFRTR